MQGHYHYDCEEWCKDCLPVDTESEGVDFDTGEQDTPAHCTACGCPLDYSLTPHGVEYVLEYIRDTLNQPEADRNSRIQSKGYYEGSRHVEIVRDWAKELSNYSLDWKDELIVSMFLELTEEGG